MEPTSDKTEEVKDDDQLRDNARNRVQSDPTATHSGQRSPSPPQPLKRLATTPIHSMSPSAPTSPRSSREVSPTRGPFKSVIPVASRLSRSRKNSQDLSPHRHPNVLNPSIPTVPSAAAIQRALSATGVSTPHLLSSTSVETQPDNTRPQKQIKGPGGAVLSVGVTPPRFKSPPLSASSTRIHSPRKTELPPLTPSIVVDLPTPNSASSADVEAEGTENMTLPGVRTPVRGTSGSSTLETVQESSLPDEPAMKATTLQSGRTEDNARLSTKEQKAESEMQPKTTKTMHESGSESGGNKITDSQTQNPKKTSKTPTTTRAPTIQPKKSVSQFNAPKAKIASEGTVRNMTVETETVSSVPQVAVQGSTGERGTLGRIDTTGSLRLKPSTETIRPKKERRKTVRKPASIHSGTGGLFSRFHHNHIYSRAECSSEDLYFEPMLSSSLPSSPVLERGHLQWMDGHGSRGGASVRHGYVYHCSQPCTPYPSRRSSMVLTVFRFQIASSKADIFEAKVASAVDEVNSSDSDETFVYESNPPEPLSARPHRYHSRTPSATSMVSQADHYSGRYRQEGHPSIAGKKSMKFSKNSQFTNGENGEYNLNSGKSGSGRTSGNNTPHHPMGRYGRAPTGHTSLFDNDSPFPNATKPLRSGNTNGSRLSPRPLTPRTPHILRVPATAGKLNVSMTYDLAGEGADDERTPLVGSVRAGRTRNSRRPPNREDDFGNYGSSSFLKRVTCCVCLGGIVGLLVAAVVVGLILCSKPLMDVHIKDIQNVLVSEQELMLDLHVHAMNPNIVAIQVSELDLDIFARSKYTGASAASMEGQASVSMGDRVPVPHSATVSNKGSTLDSAKTSPLYHSTEGVDEGTDPIEDPEGDPPAMMLGRILDFDSPLIFDASPLQHLSVSSIGEVRLAHPGNGTAGGSKQWEKVIQHPFELRVKGVLHYSLPISSKVRSANIASTITVHPDAPVDDEGRNVTRRSKYPAASGMKRLWPNSAEGRVRSARFRA